MACISSVIGSPDEVWFKWGSFTRASRTSFHYQSWFHSSRLINAISVIAAVQSVSCRLQNIKETSAARCQHRANNVRHHDRNSAGHASSLGIQNSWSSNRYLAVRAVSCSKSSCCFWYLGVGNRSMGNKIAVLSNLYTPRCPVDSHSLCRLTQTHIYSPREAIAAWTRCPKHKPEREIQISLWPARAPSCKKASEIVEGPSLVEKRFGFPLRWLSLTYFCHSVIM